MTHKLRTNTKLYNLLDRLDLSYDEAEHALSLYAHNKKFDKDLDEHYNVDNDVIDEDDLSLQRIDVNYNVNNDDIIDEDWDDWHPNDL